MVAIGLPTALTAGAASLVRVLPPALTSGVAIVGGLPGTEPSGTFRSMRPPGHGTARHRGPVAFFVVGVRDGLRPWSRPAAPSGPVRATRQFWTRRRCEWRCGPTRMGVLLD